MAVVIESGEGNRDWLKKTEGMTEDRFIERVFVEYVPENDQWEL